MPTIQFTSKFLRVVKRSFTWMRVFFYLYNHSPFCYNCSTCLIILMRSAKSALIAWPEIYRHKFCHLTKYISLGNVGKTNKSRRGRTWHTSKFAVLRRINRRIAARATVSHSFPRKLGTVPSAVPKRNFAAGIGLCRRSTRQGERIKLLSTRQTRSVFTRE